MRKTHPGRLSALAVAFLLMGATLGSAGAAEESDAGVVGAEEISGAGVTTGDGRTSSGSGWKLLKCTSASTTAEPYASGTETDEFVTTDPCLAIRLSSPILGGSWSLSILDSNGDTTPFCPGCGSYTSSRYNYNGMFLVSRDIFWYIKDRSRDLGTYRLRVCTSSTCTTTLVNEPFEIAPTIVRFRSVGAEDGWVLEKSESASVGSRQNSGATTLRVGDNYKDSQYRSILSFDTSSLPNNAVITGVTLRVKQKSVTGKNPFATHRPLYVDIRKGFFGSSANLQVGDFEATASKTRVGSFGNSPSGGWYTAVLSSTAHGRINLKGTTQFRLRFKLDDNDDHGNDFVALSSGNAGAKSRPQLLIEYYIP